MFIYKMVSECLLAFLGIDSTEKYYFKFSSLKNDKYLLLPRTYVTHQEESIIWLQYIKFLQNCEPMAVNNK